MIAMYLIFLPIFASGLVYFISKNNESIAKYVALGWFIVLFIILGNAAFFIERQRSRKY